MGHARVTKNQTIEPSNNHETITINKHHYTLLLYTLAVFEEPKPKTNTPPPQIREGYEATEPMLITIEMGRKDAPSSKDIGQTLVDFFRSQLKIASTSKVVETPKDSGNIKFTAYGGTLGEFSKHNLTTDFQNKMWGVKENYRLYKALSKETFITVVVEQGMKDEGEPFHAGNYLVGVFETAFDGKYKPSLHVSMPSTDYGKIKIYGHTTFLGEYERSILSDKEKAVDMVLEMMNAYKKVAEALRIEADARIQEAIDAIRPKNDWR